MTDSSYAVVYSKCGEWGIDACYSSREEALREAFESWEEGTSFPVAIVNLQDKTFEVFSFDVHRYLAEKVKQEFSCTGSVELWSLGFECE